MSFPSADLPGTDSSPRKESKRLLHAWKETPNLSIQGGQEDEGSAAFSQVRSLESPTTPMVGSSHCRDFLRALSLNCPFLLTVWFSHIVALLPASPLERKHCHRLCFSPQDSLAPDRPWASHPYCPLSSAKPGPLPAHSCFNCQVPQNYLQALLSLLHTGP